VTTEEQSFESAQRELEDIVERLERGDASLDQAIALWQRGEQLYRLCRGKLDAAEGEIEELAKRVEAAAPEPG
jgi:exodeoxyribonuclease VII small subunit